MSLKLLSSFFAIALTVGAPIVLNAQKGNDKVITLTGTVTDAVTGEKLSGATLLLSEENKGTISNQYGFFSLSSSQGLSKKVEVKYLGFTPYSFTYRFNKDSVVTIQLVPETILLGAVEVKDDRDEDISYESDRILLTPNKIRKTASFAGEPDVLKTLQLLPGVQSGNEGTTNISVRGGSFDQNLILLDEAPVYNPSHALSFFSIFNVDALQSIEFYKSAIPVKYGGRLSSVVDIRMKEGNRKKRQFTGSIGAIASRLTIEGPISKNEKWSYLISGRYSYAGQVVNGIYFLGQRFFRDETANRSTTDNKINFYDLNGKINYTLNSKNQFFISNYSGQDKFYFNHITSGYDLSWGNNTSTIRWNHIYSKKLFANSTLVYSDYKYQYRLLNNTQYFTWSANLREEQFKQDFDLFLNENNHITFGFGVQNHVINPGQIKPRDARSVSSFYKLPDKLAIGSNVYIGNVQSISSKITLTYGLRYSNFGLRGKRWEYTFDTEREAPDDSSFTSSVRLSHRIDPRVAIKLKGNAASYSFSYDRTTQFFHLLANSSVGLPTDVWWPSSNNIKPQYANIFAFSFERQLNQTYGLNSSVFYKSIGNAVDFRDNARLFVNRYVESELLQGNAKAYGFELFLEKKQGKVTGSLAYTQSKTYNKIQGVNNGEAYPTRYDKRHNFSSTLRCQLSPRVDLSANFVLTSGGALTIPAGAFVFDGIPFNYYTKRNEYRLPLYHRMDLSFKYKSKKNDSRNYKSYWSLDLYNVYAKKNPFTLYAIQSDYGFYKADPKAFFIYSIVPSLSYNFSF